MPWENELVRKNYDPKRAYEFMHEPGVVQEGLPFASLYRDYLNANAEVKARILAFVKAKAIEMGFDLDQIDYDEFIKWFSMLPEKPDEDDEGDMFKNDMDAIGNYNYKQAAPPGSYPEDYYTTGIGVEPDWVNTDDLESAEGVRYPYYEGGMSREPKKGDDPYGGFKQIFQAKNSDELPPINVVEWQDEQGKVHRNISNGNHRYVVYKYANEKGVPGADRIPAAVERKHDRLKNPNEYYSRRSAMEAAKNLPNKEKENIPDWKRILMEKGGWEDYLKAKDEALKWHSPFK